MEGSFITNGLGVGNVDQKYLTFIVADKICSSCGFYYQIIQIEQAILKKSGE